VREVHHIMTSGRIDPECDLAILINSNCYSLRTVITIASPVINGWYYVQLEAGDA
jgi:hypothetical protein